MGPTLEYYKLVLVFSFSAAISQPLLSSGLVSHFIRFCRASPPDACLHLLCWCVCQSMYIHLEKVVNCHTYCSLLIVHPPILHTKLGSKVGKGLMLEY